MLGGFLADRTPHFSHRQEGTADVYLLADAADGKLGRALVALVPAERGGAVECGTLTLALPAGAAAKYWTARAVHYSAETPPQVFPVVPTRSGDSLILPVNQPGSGTWLLLLAEDATALPKLTQP